MLHRQSLLAALFLLLVAGCAGNQDADTYEVRGRVVGFAYGGEAVIIDHESIPGYMRAMRMTMRPENRTMLHDVEEGDAVSFRLVVPEHDAPFIDRLEQLPPDTQLDLPASVGSHALDVEPDSAAADTTATTDTTSADTATAETSTPPDTTGDAE